MEAQDPPPKHIKIYPDFRGSYAWDEEGYLIEIACYWPDVPGLRDLEENLVAWADTYEREQENKSYDWESFDRRGRRAALNIARALAPKGVPVFFYGELLDPLESM